MLELIKEIQLIYVVAEDDELLEKYMRQKNVYIWSYVMEGSYQHLFGVAVAEDIEVLHVK